MTELWVLGWKAFMNMYSVNQLRGLHYKHVLQCRRHYDRVVVVRLEGYHAS